MSEKIRVTDLISQQILRMLEQDGGRVKIQRNELAGQLGCVPSQINYVITNRFTLEQGYLVQSRRGGGGFIQIIKLQYSSSEAIFHLVNSIGDMIDEYSSRIILQNLTYDNILSEKECKIIISALLDSNFKCLDDHQKKMVRANLLKTMLLQTIEME